ncbi:MAG TPA: hypothetical protein VK928_01840 [Longimicrobiales bacterium]|nr:hypothetical protein [Longimicrobiales bacterium]
MTFDEFERAAYADWERIPEAYLAGVDGLVVERKAVPHPSLPDIYTLGECLTESYPSDFGSADTTRSLVVLYYGSFFRLSRLDPGFDWEGELWETLTHELQHHLESLARDDALGDMDYAADENFRRYEGEPFDPFFYRQGVPEDGWLRVEDEYFLELAGSEGELEFEWRGRRYVADAPRERAAVTLVTITGGVSDAPTALHLVLVRPRSPLGILRDAFTGRTPDVIETESAARGL